MIRNALKTARYALPVCYFAMTACTSVQVKQVHYEEHPLIFVCIERDPKVMVEDFLDVLQDGFWRHAVETQVFDAPLPEYCEYHLHYTARRSWDMAPYLSYAELILKQRNLLIGKAIYEHIGGSMSMAYFTKWAGTQSKMDPVIDELLAEY